MCIRDRHDPNLETAYFRAPSQPSFQQHQASPVKEQQQSSTPLKQSPMKIPPTKLQPSPQKEDDGRGNLKTIKSKLDELQRSKVALEERMKVFENRMRESKKK
eukprot:TRINITY_DN11163_c0_g1_i1.p1 TRINITY_DN11163_c0_g1~~TRINITY_DN11163_c0_g1_i1.p1  ORF type:complete len:103 (-),score=24.20 TRINITY_DN11163_c0_g1_i1:150-458(-)